MTYARAILIPEAKRDLAIHRIMKRVRKMRSGCWMWTGSKCDRGYGIARMFGSVYMVHRLYFTLVSGPVDTSLDLDHLCRTKACLNPAHLEPVTKRTNIRRARGFFGPDTHCCNGHERTTEKQLHNEGRSDDLSNL